MLASGVPVSVWAGGGGRDHCGGDFPRPVVPVHFPPTATPTSIALAFVLVADVATTTAILWVVAVPWWLPPAKFPPSQPGPSRPPRAFRGPRQRRHEQRRQDGGGGGRLAAASYALL